MLTRRGERLPATCSPKCMHTHTTCPVMRGLILTSVIFTEGFRESNHEGSVWKPECRLFCWAVLLDSTPQHSSAHSPQATHADIKNSLQTDDARQIENTTSCCSCSQIASFCQTLGNGITDLVAVTVKGLDADFCLTEQRFCGGWAFVQQQEAPRVPKGQADPSHAYRLESSGTQGGQRGWETSQGSDVEWVTSLTGIVYAHEFPTILGMNLQCHICLCLPLSSAEWGCDMVSEC